MILYLHIVFLCVSVLSSFGFDFNNAEGQELLQFDRETKLEHQTPGLGSSQVSQVTDKKVCEKAVTLHKILGVMTSMLRQDIPENAKTAYILETLKDLLQNTAGYNAEVMFKIDDLLKSLNKYKDIGFGSKKQPLRMRLNVAPTTVTKRKPLNQNVLNHQLPKLTNSYCTEALQSIIKIAYEAYVSLAKNPICNLPTVPNFPFKIPGSEHVPFNPDNHISPHNVFPPFHLDSPSSSLPPRTPNPYYILNVDQNTWIPTINFKPIYSPDPYNRYPENQFPPIYDPYSPQNPNNLHPMQPNNPFFIPPVNNFPNKFNLHNLFPEIPNNIPLNPNSLYPEHSYNPSLKPNQFYPWQPNPDLSPNPGNPQTNHINPYYPNSNNGPKIPWPFSIINNLPEGFSWDKNPQKYNPNGPYNVNPLVPYPFDLQKLIQSEIYPFDVNQNLFDSVSPHFPQLPTNHIHKPETSQINPSDPDFKPYPDSFVPSLNFPEVFPFAVSPQSNQYNPYFPDFNKSPDKPVGPPWVEKLPDGSPYDKNPRVLNPNRPYTPQSHDKNKPENFPFHINQNPFHPHIPASELPYPPNNHINLLPNTPDHPNSHNPNKPNRIPTDEIYIHEFELNPNDPNYPIIPTRAPYDWVPHSSVNPQTNAPPNRFPLLPTHEIPQTNMQVPELETIGFIREAIGFIEAIVPVVKFDPPTMIVIAKIKDILQHSDEEIIDQYVTIISLYDKIISYVKQLNVYKELIDLVDLHRVTNHPKLENKKVVELTYLLKHPHPVVYYPYYYVKYRLPYSTIIVTAKNLIAQRPYLRNNPKELYEELLALSNVAETSPGLKSYNKEDIHRLTFKSGSLIDAKLLSTTGTLNEQLNLLKDITSDFTVEDIMELNNQAISQAKMLGASPLSSDTYQIDVKANSLKSHKTKKLKTPTGEFEPSSPVTNSLSKPLVQNPFYLDKPIQTEPINEAGDDITSFDSGKLRGDILRGQYVGLPFSDYVSPTNMNPLHDLREPDPSVNIGPIAPAMYKLYEATLKAENLRKGIQKNSLNDGGFKNHDDEEISLNTGAGNQQSHLNVVNPNEVNVMKNSTPIKHGLLNLGDKNALVQRSMMNSENYKHAAIDQKNHYSSGGLVNYDNERISLNSGTGNVQDDNNFVNPKVMLNAAKSSNSDPTRSFKSVGQLDFMNVNAFSNGNGYLYKNVENTERFPLNNQLDSVNMDSEMAIDATQYMRPSVLNHGNLNSEMTIDGAKYIRPDVSSFQNGGLKIAGDGANYHPDLFNFNNHNGIDAIKKIKAENQLYMNEATTRQSNLLNVGNTKIYVNTGLPNKLASPLMHQESTIRPDQAPNDGTSILLNTGEKNKQNKVNFNNINKVLNNGAVEGLNNIDLKKILLNTGTSNTQNKVNFNNNKMIMNSGAAAKHLVNYDDTKIMMNTGRGNEQNSVSFNNNRLVMNNDQNLDKLSYQTAMQQMFQPNSGNFNFDTGTTQNFANIGMGQEVGLGQGNPQSINFGAYQKVQGVPESQISSYQIQRFPILQRGPITQKFTKSSMVLMNQFRRPVSLTPIG